MSYANRILGSIPYGTLIGAPLTAAVEAQALAAQASVEFIRAVGFTSSGFGEDFAEVRTITFSFTMRDTEDDEGRTATLSVPLLTIVPIPYLRIDDMTIDFTSKITEELVNTSKNDSTVETNTNLNIGYGNFLTPVKVGLKGSVSTKHSSSSATSNRYKTEHTINVNVRAVQDDIPPGLSRVLDILESGIGERTTSGT